MARKRHSMVDWSSIPYHFELILSKLNYISPRDCIVVAATCRDWHAAAKQSDTSFRYNLLMPISTSPYSYQIATEDSVRCFHDIATSKPFQIYLPEFRGFVLFRSLFDGWLIAFSCPPKPEIKLFNPFSRSSIPLPDLRAILDPLYDCVGNAVLTASPGDPDCLVILQHVPGKVAFSRPGSDAWCAIPTDLYCLPLLSSSHHFICHCYDSQHNLVLPLSEIAPPLELDHRVTQLGQIWEYHGGGEGTISMSYHLVEI